MKIVISLSGGMDSATLLGYYINKKDTVMAVSFHYGSKHNEFELEAAKKLARYYSIPHKIVKIDTIFENIKSNLLMSGGNIPEGHYEEESMKVTIVPGRNLIFSSILAAIAESNNYNAIALGVHSGDHAIYPDCRPGFMLGLNEVIFHSSDFKLIALSPFLNLNKTEILKTGFNIGVPYQFTRTCYKHQEVSCGKCGSCTERLEAFSNIGETDPVKYEG